MTGFNYDRAHNKGIELEVRYKAGNLQAYSNLASGVHAATDDVSNQLLFHPDELAYVATPLYLHGTYTGPRPEWTGSVGMSYLWNGTRFSTDMIYGSSLRSGFTDIGELPSFTQVTLAFPMKSNGTAK